MPISKDNIFPSGWFCIATSKELRRGKLKIFNCFNQEVLLFRGKNKIVSAFDPFCPHMGAHLGYGGKVKKNTIVCPFHGWQFNQDTSGLIKSDPKNKGHCKPLKNYICQEINNRIFIWFSEKDEKPFYNIPNVRNDVKKHWFPTITIRWKIKTPFEEILKNGPDLIHYKKVHNLKDIKLNKIESNKENFLINLDINTGLGLKKFDTQVDIKYYGPGYFKTEMKGKISLAILFDLIPISEKEMILRQEYFLPKTLNPFKAIVSFFAFLTSLPELKKDIKIWEKKRPDNAQLTSDEVPFKAFGSWLNSFYPDSERPS